LLGSLVVPSGIAYLLFALGLLARLVPPARRFSWGLLACGAAITLLFSSGQVAAALLSPLEYEYPAVLDARAHPDARKIVVLGAWAADDDELPVTGRLNASAAYRVLMAAELYRQRPEDLEVIVTGSPVTTAVMSDSLIAAGVPSSRITREDRSAVTAESAENVKALVSGAPFFLVTSAGHLRRAMATMRKQDLDPIAVPTDHKQPRAWTRAEFAPRPESLSHSDLAIHEFIGRLWYSIRDRA
jgi:uncharacterized SAM-binding protein YcdF (DUF218 family)